MIQVGVNLEKNERCVLRNENNKGLNNIMVGLGWDPVSRSATMETMKEKKGFFDKLKHAGAVSRERVSSSNIDCDAFAVLISSGDQNMKDDTIYFGNGKHRTGAVNYSGDNLTGKGDGDDERMYVTLKRLPASYKEVYLGVNIYSAKERKQTFGNIENAYIRIVDEETNTEMCRFSLSNNAEYANEVAMVLGKLIRTGNGWEFEALGTPAKEGSILAIANGIKRMA